MVDIPIRGELWDNDSSDILRWWGWRDITAPMDIEQALRDANGDDVTVLVNSGGGRRDSLDTAPVQRKCDRIDPGTCGQRSNAGNFRVPHDPLRAGSAAVLPQPERRRGGRPPRNEPRSSGTAECARLHPRNV